MIDFEEVIIVILDEECLVVDFILDLIINCYVLVSGIVMVRLFNYGIFEGDCINDWFYEVFDKMVGDLLYDLFWKFD